MTAESDIAALSDGGANPIAEIRTALTSVLGRADASVVVAGQMALASSQTGLSNSADDKIDFDTEVFDTDGDLVDVANSRFVIQDTGYYLVIGSWAWEVTFPDSDGYVVVYVDGSEGNIPMARGVFNQSYKSREITGVLSLTATDTVELYVNTGGTSSVAARGNASGHLRTTFTIVRLF